MDRNKDWRVTIFGGRRSNGGGAAGIVLGQTDRNGTLVARKKAG